MEAKLVSWQADGGVGRLIMDRPPLNVINMEMIYALRAALAEAAKAEALRVLVVSAQGRMFSAGVDVADHTADKVGEMIPLFDGVCRSLAEFPAPTLAVVHGHALGGGCELALCCDLVLAAEGARLGQPEIKLATFPPVAALRMPRLIGYRRAAELVLTGEPFDARAAAEAGLINRAVPAAELDGEVDKLVGNLSALSAPALLLCKRALRLGADAWAKLPEIERLYLDELMSTPDAHEGVASFMEKRAPVWTHT